VFTASFSCSPSWKAPRRNRPPSPRSSLRQASCCPKRRGISSTCLTNRRSVIPNRNHCHNQKRKMMELLTTQLQTRLTTDTPVLGSNRRLTWYPSVFNQVARIKQKLAGKVQSWNEVIRSGAFTDTIANGGHEGEIVGNVNHLMDQTFAKRTSGELLLQED